MVTYKRFVLFLVMLLAVSLGAGCRPQGTDPYNDPEPVNGENGSAGPGRHELEGTFTVEDVFPDMDFDRPLDLQHAGDGSDRIYVVEQAGRINVLSGVGAPEPLLFLNITDRVDDSGFEMGLLGLAFHPEFLTGQPYFFVNYTNSSSTVISRFTVNVDNTYSVDPASEEILLTFAQPFRNHNGGQVSFGPDGYLYIATGDGGSGGDPQGHGQNRRTLHGNILRIDVDNQDPGLSYAIPQDNPFAGNTEGYREEIYAYGLRNPWRFSFDPPTGRLWVADVGQNEVEEINIVESGKNYGWNIMEGSRCFNPAQNCDTEGLELPVYEYRHPLGRSITGGFVYRGERLPQLDGAYIYADFGTGLIWALWVEDGATENITLVDTNLQITSFGINEENELFFTAFDGKIYRLALQP